jgi:osmotically-inducible protein OsmY
MHKPNNLLESDIKESLDWDPGLDDSRIRVTADDGRVTLSGSVPTYYDEVLATEDAWTVAGVKALDDQLLVGLLGDAIADADIAADCEAALDRDRFVPKGSVTATVLEGTVTLRGEVRHHYQRRAAEHAVSRVDGVLGIDNLLTISSEPIPSGRATAAGNMTRSRKRMFHASAYAAGWRWRPIWWLASTDTDHPRRARSRRGAPGLSTT